MDLLPILHTLKRHKTAAGLIVVQIALTCAIVCNALFLVSQRVEAINAPTGMPDNELLVLGVTGLARGENPVPQTQADLAALRAIPGVKSVVNINQMPFGDDSDNSGVRLDPDENTKPQFGAATYYAGEGWLETLGLHLVEGRDFVPSEYVEGSQAFEQENPDIPAVIVNRAAAEKLFPGESALGKQIYVFGTKPHRIVGVVETLIHPYPSFNSQDDNQRYTVLAPARPSWRGGAYMLRVDPARRETVLKAAAKALDEGSVGVKRIVRRQKLFADMRSDYYRADRTMVWLLCAVCAAMLVVTAFGIVGLASFWVEQRTRMIGTRRALGATRGQILRYFQTENFLLSGIGIALGCGAAWVLSLVLMQQYELPRLPAYYLPAGAAILWALGQIAVWAPARRASLISPVEALRG
ncbi:MAG: ABC transporter permease [Pelomonas sp.]|nr:ABC transporter permease [Roseateles sp.]